MKPTLFKEIRNTVRVYPHWEYKQGRVAQKVSLGENDDWPRKLMCHKLVHGSGKYVVWDKKDRWLDAWQHAPLQFTKTEPIRRWFSGYGSVSIQVENRLLEYKEPATIRLEMETQFNIDTDRPWFLHPESEGVSTVCQFRQELWITQPPKRLMCGTRAVFMPDKVARAFVSGKTKTINDWSGFPFHDFSPNLPVHIHKGVDIPDIPHANATCVLQDSFLSVDEGRPPIEGIARPVSLKSLDDLIRKETTAI